MKRTPLAVCVSSAALFATVAVGSGRSDIKAGEQQLIRMEQEWANATLKHDTAAIQRFEADGFTYYLDGKTGTKSDDVADAQNWALIADALDESGVTVHLFADTAIVRGKASAKNAKYKGNDISGEYMFTDTWVLRNGRWQIVASHASRVGPM
jgi:ketosteroid isomerase-like protein